MDLETLVTELRKDAETQGGQLIREERLPDVKKLYALGSRDPYHIYVAGHSVALQLVFKEKESLDAFVRSAGQKFETQIARVQNATVESVDSFGAYVCVVRFYWTGK